MHVNIHACEVGLGPFYSLRVNIHDEQINHLHFIDDLWSTCLLGISAFHWCHDITYLLQFTTRYLGFLIWNYWFLQNDIILRRFVTVSFFRMILNWEFTRFTRLLEINNFSLLSCFSYLRCSIILSIRWVITTRG